MRLRAGTTLLLCALLVPVAGCAPKATGTGAFTKVVYEVRGGVAGFDRHFAIAADGAYSVRDRGRPDRAGTLPAADVRLLRAAIAKADWSAVAGAYVEPRMADALIETVTLTVAGREYQVVVGSGVIPPAQVQPALDLLRRVLTDRLAK